MAERQTRAPLNSLADSFLRPNGQKGKENKTSQLKRKQWKFQPHRTWPGKTENKKKSSPHVNLKLNLNRDFISILIFSVLADLYLVFHANSVSVCLRILI